VNGSIVPGIRYGRPAYVAIGCVNVRKPGETWVTWRLDGTAKPSDPRMLEWDGR